MSSQLDAQVGSDTKANPYLVCFCDERNECIVCAKHDYYTTAGGVFSSTVKGIRNAGRKAGKHVNNAYHASNGEDWHAKAVRKQKYMDKQMDGSDYSFWSDIKKKNQNCLSRLLTLPDLNMTGG